MSGRLVVAALLVAACGSGRSAPPGTAPPERGNTAPAEPPREMVPGRFVRVSPAGQVVVSAGNALVFYDVSEGKLAERRRLRSVDLGGRTVGNFAFSRTGDRVAVIVADDTISLVDVMTGKVVRSFQTREPPLETVAMSDEVIVAGGPTGWVWRSWLSRPRDMGAHVALTSNHIGSATPVALMPDGKRLLVGASTTGMENAHPCLALVEPPGDFVDEVTAPLTDCDIEDIATWSSGAVWVGRGLRAGKFETADVAVLGAAQPMSALRVVKIEGPDREPSLGLSAVAILDEGDRIVVGEDWGGIWIVELATGKRERVLRPRNQVGDRDPRPYVYGLAAADRFIVAVHTDGGADPVVRIYPR